LLLCREEDSQILLAKMMSADPLPIGPGEWQGQSNIAAGYETACLHANKPKEHSVEPSESTTSESSSIQQASRQPLDNTGYKADARPVSEQRSEQAHYLLLLD